MNRRHLIPNTVWLALSLVTGVAFAAGCSAGADGSDSTGSAVTAIDEGKELETILGDDRVATYLKAHSSAIPNHLDKTEAAFGVGRKCNRTDSKEIWVAEEKDTRYSGAQVPTSVTTPRLAIGGCQQQLGNLQQSFEMMIAMTADMTRPTDDLLPNQPVEIMALDKTTGLYNFYVLEPGATEQDNATVSRFVRLPDDTVQKWTKVSGQAATKEDFPQRKCFNCHVNGGLVMNEMTEPWTNWVSSHKTLSRPMTGATHELVSEARPFPGDGFTRSTLANQLEPIIRQGLAVSTEGLPGAAGSGLGPQTLSGKQPGGVERLLKSVFCESEVNYATVLAPDQVPASLFIDTGVASLAAIDPPVPPLNGAAFTLLPVRSEADKRIEIFLEKQKLLTPDTVMAVRVFDDTHEIFSTARCALHADVTSRIAAGTSVEEATKAALLAAVDQSSVTSTAGRDYIKVLVGTDSSNRDTLENAYIADITQRLQTDADQLNDSTGLDALSSRWADRQASARAMFPQPENMLPITLPSSSVASAH